MGSQVTEWGISPITGKSFITGATVPFGQRVVNIATSMKWMTRTALGRGRGAVSGPAVKFEGLYYPSTTRAFTRVFTGSYVYSPKMVFGYRSYMSNLFAQMEAKGLATWGGGTIAGVRTVLTPRGWTGSPAAIKAYDAARAAEAARRLDAVVGTRTSYGTEFTRPLNREEWAARQPPGSNLSTKAYTAYLDSLPSGKVLVTRGEVIGWVRESGVQSAIGRYGRRIVERALGKSETGQLIKFTLARQAALEATEVRWATRSFGEARKGLTGEEVTVKIPERRITGGQIVTAEVQVPPKTIQVSFYHGKEIPGPLVSRYIKTYGPGALEYRPIEVPGYTMAIEGRAPWVVGVGPRSFVDPIQYEMALSYTGLYETIPTVAGLRNIWGYAFTSPSLAAASTVAPVSAAALVYLSSIKWPVTRPATIPVTTPIVEPVTQPVTQPILQPITEPVTTPVTAPITQPVLQPVTLPVTLPVTEPITRPITRPVTRPITEPITSPITTPISIPVVMPVTIPVTTPVTTPVGTPGPTVIPIIPFVLPLFGGAGLGAGGARRSKFSRLLRGKRWDWPSLILYFPEPFKMGHTQVVLAKKRTRKYGAGEQLDAILAKGIRI